MRPPSLQNFYLEKPATLLMIITILSVFIWIGRSDFYTKGEPREASVAVSMINNNHWILPEVYADEISYKPPLMHWMTAIFSLPEGKVTPFASRLPSALAFMGLIFCSFTFFGRNLRMQESFLASLILLTTLELHRSAFAARVDMLLTLLIVWALTRLFRWEEKSKLSTFPWLIPIIMSLAVLTKGPVGIVLPLLIFGVYLLFLHYNFWKIIIKLIPLALLASIIPLIWYCLAYQQGGKDFLDLILAENFGRFWETNNLNIQYDLGHDKGWWYNWVMLIAGFIPWTLLLAISLFCLPYKRFPGFKSLLNSFPKMEKTKLFSLIAAAIIFFFYSIPSSKRSVYLMPAYPFIAIFIAQYILYLTEYKTIIIRVFAIFVGLAASAFGLMTLLTVTTGWVNPVDLFSNSINDFARLEQFYEIWQSSNFSHILSIVLLIILSFSIFFLFKSLYKKVYLKTLYATFGIYLSMLLMLDGLLFPGYQNAISVKHISNNLNENYTLTDNNLFVMNNLLEYSNMYGLNFYLNNSFRNFEQVLPNEGYFLSGNKSFEKVFQKYNSDYNFNLLEEYPNYSRDGERIIQFYSFKKK